jgi:hypothetical protein
MKYQCDIHSVENMKYQYNIYSVENLISKYTIKKHVGTAPNWVNWRQYKCSFDIQDTVQHDIVL